MLEAERHELKQDVFSLLRHERGGHIEKWLYTDELFIQDGYTGAGLMDAFNGSAHNYYVLSNTQKLMPRVVNCLQKLNTEFQVIADFGCGGEKALASKAVPIIAGCKNVRIYAPLDISQQHLLAAKKIVNDRFPEIKVTPQNIDFLKDEVTLPQGRKLGLAIGSIISNLDMREGDDLPIEEAVRVLKLIKNPLSSGDTMLFDYDSNRDQRSVFAAYDNLFGNRFVSNFMYLIHEKLSPKGAFYPSQWRHEMVWDTKKDVLHHCIVCSMDQDFEIGGERFRTKRGERFVAINCIKYPIPLFNEISETAGFKLLEPIQDDEQKMTFQPLISL